MPAAQEEVTTLDILKQTEHNIVQSVHAPSDLQNTR